MRPFAEGEISDLITLHCCVYERGREGQRKIFETDLLPLLFSDSNKELEVLIRRIYI